MWDRTEQVESHECGHGVHGEGLLIELDSICQFSWGAAGAKLHLEGGSHNGKKVKPFQVSLDFTLQILSLRGCSR